MPLRIYLGPGLAGEALFNLPEAARALFLPDNTIPRAALRVSEKLRHGVITRMMTSPFNPKHWLLCHMGLY